MPRLSLTDIAARCSVHKSTVSRQARAAGLVGEDGKVDLAAYQALRSGLDPAFQTSPASVPLTKTDEMSEERLRQLAANREKAEIELAIRKGELVPLAEVAGEQEDVFRQLRDALMQLPRQLGESLAEIDQPIVIEARIRKALNLALRSFADHLEQDDDAAGRPGQREDRGVQGGGAGASPAA